jgi:chromosome partitioning protein
VAEENWANDGAAGSPFAPPDSEQGKRCSVCGDVFIPSLAIHISNKGGQLRYYCSEVCRQQEHPPAAKSTGRPARTLAILNQKGGTAKTTTAVSLAAGFARVGERTLLIDLDPQGNVAVSLGVRGPRTAYHLLMRGVPPSVCAVPAREKLDVISSDEALAAAEIQLARADEGERTLRLQQAMSSLSGYDYVVIDCAPSLSVLNHNALAYADEVLIPVSCDYLSLVGVKQVMRTLCRVGERLHRDIRVAGVLPTFYDVRKRLCVESVGYLRKSFGARTLPPVRINTRLAEAPSLKKTIFEHAPDSNGARDYIRVIEWLRAAHSQSAKVERAA